jgi:hypothetical protein
VFLRGLFENDANREAFLCRSVLFDRIREATRPIGEEVVNEDSQRSAKLHILFGAATLKYGQTQPVNTYPFACSKRV